MQNIKETEEYIVVEFTNDSGKKYEVGYPKAAGYTKENIEAEIANANEKLKANASSDESTFQTLVWVVNGDSTTSRAAIDIGIVGGYVDRDPNNKCQLNFANSKGWGFTFIDQTGDTYFCSTFRDGNHYVNYTSAKPTIIGVR